MFCVVGLDDIAVILVQLSCYSLQFAFLMTVLTKIIISNLFARPFLTTGETHTLSGVEVD